MKTFISKTIIFSMIVTQIILSSKLDAQLTELNQERVFSEGSFYRDEAGVLYTDNIVVKFNDHVFRSTKGMIYKPGVFIPLLFVAAF